MPSPTAACLSFTRVLALGLLLAAAGCAQTPAPAAPSASPAAENGEKAGGKCYQGCITWGESCNVDPRGVYKCQRRCEKFGEICE